MNDLVKAATISAVAPTIAALASAWLVIHQTNAKTEEKAAETNAKVDKVAKNTDGNVSRLNDQVESQASKIDEMHQRIVVTATHTDLTTQAAIEKDIKGQDNP